VQLVQPGRDQAVLVGTAPVHPRQPDGVPGGIDDPRAVTPLPHEAQRGITKFIPVWSLDGGTPGRAGADRPARRDCLSDYASSLTWTLWTPADSKRHDRSKLTGHGPC
jgi:hypothetical protein